MNTPISTGLTAALLCFTTMTFSGCNSTPTATSNEVADHLALFSPPPMHPVSGSRAADGRPGPGYWQQQADYVIKAELDPAKRKVTATGVLTYTNNSPMNLPFIWFELPVDAFRADSRSSAIRHVNNRFDASGTDMGFRDLTFSIDGTPIEPIISDTRALVRLPRPLLAGGDRIDIELVWSLKVPEGSSRMGVLEFENDELFEIARWIPQPCVYDDIYGWNTLPYLGAGESYSDFGDYDVTVTAPLGVTVVGGGEWINPQQRLTPAQYRRYQDAIASDETIWIITPEEAALPEQADEQGDESDGGNAGSGGDEPTADPETQPVETVTWRYIANNVRTFAFVAGRSYAMDGAGVEIDNRRVRCLSVFPPKVSELWHSTSTEAIRHALSFYSGFLGLDYPYPIMVNCFGVEGGTEYPMMVFCGSKQPEKPDAPENPDETVVLDDGTETTAQARFDEKMEAYDKRYERAQRGLFGVTDHEVLHSWFPMIVGNDERRDGWMDEGFNEYGNPYSLVAWEEAHKDEMDEAPEDRDPDGISGRSGTAEFDAADALSVVRKISDYAFHRPVPPILTWADQSMAHGARGLNVYSKPAAGLITLREGVLGPERFDHALTMYLNAWAFKHPRPGDFFRCIENAAGEDLGWFWNGWFAQTHKLDLAVRDVAYQEPARGDPFWAIGLEMVAQIPAPLSVRVEFDTGEQKIYRVPVEAWYGGREFTLRLNDETRTPFNVLIDPDRVLPDADRTNNRWVGQPSGG